MSPRDLFGPEHAQFRATVARFLEREVAPHVERWEARGGFERELFHRAGAAGLLCPTVPETHGGPGADRLYTAALLEEAARYSNIGLSFAMHSDIVSNYLMHYGSEALQQAYLPRMVAGEVVGALAMTEPGGGSDVKAVRTTAVRDGGHYVVSGSKTFISNATVCDMVVVVVKTDPRAGAKGVSLLVVDADSPGLTKGAPLKKIGLKSQDTGELFFDQVRVPVANLLGEENQGFAYLMRELPWERLQIAVSAIAAAEAAYGWTLEYVRQRQAFGQAVADFQATRFTLAELKTELQIGRVFVDRCLQLLMRGELDAQMASMAKYWTTDLQGKVVDACVQLHGGYGFMAEYPIAKAYVDARAQRIYGGTNEIMKELIARDL
ncbi:acyl-CoA dehydrogenase family protein [Pseudorhodoferax sp. Leaf274]|uniref:acyl-CoA dehydrogenase family protein n=1 Tax=Pseudorhodoferax sp. Leaf274 TaxID=1736318 RepID=UPI000702A477|nr:acyl-CoA dehydrogenase family protein [Pseudorhodoferax sp. Leaf274]KQP45490.1 acyl-CoA dehydrogenase [Pseudorhodoferax sp. Leaf274]